MTPLNPATRPCTLWGSTFDARLYVDYSIGQSNINNYQATISLFGASKNKKIAEFVFDYPDDVTSTFEERSFLKRKLRELDKAITEGLHPPLCMKHALEVGYEFRKGQKYLFGGDPALEHFFHTFLEGEGVDPKQNPSHEEIIWFKPVDSEDNPTHGEAEAVVNAWKEGE